MIDPVEHLARDDKWQLGAGDGTRFAPTFPIWLDVPGFWDEAMLGDVGFGPLFTISVLDDEGRELAAKVTARRWTPAELTLQYRLGQGLTATEVRTVHPGGIFASEWRFAAYRPARIHLVAWTAQDGAGVERGSAAFNGAVAFDRTIAGGEHAPSRVHAELGCSGSATSWGVLRAERGVPPPKWNLAPFAEQWRGGALPRAVGAEGSSLQGSFFAAVHRSLDVEYGGASATFALRLVSAERMPSPAPPMDATTSKSGTFGGASRRRWAAYLSGLPRFRSSDPYFETLWWYRWYCSRLYGAPGDVRELRWTGDPTGARELVRALTGEALGEALVALDAVWPDDAFVREIFPKLARFAERLVKTGDAEGTGLFDLDDRGEDRDVRALGRATRLKGVDATVRAYALFRSLEKLAPRAGANQSAEHWAGIAARVREAMRGRMWDAARGMFSDIDADTLARTDVKAAVCFLPYGTDVAGVEHVPGLERHLLDPAEFWTAFPVPSLSVDDPRFSAEGEWDGRIADRPWNGRTWPSLNSRLVDALAHTARSHAPQLRDSAATLLRRFVRMMFHGGELHRANSHDHYNPFTGHASVHRGFDDVRHSWVNDLILRHVMGIQVSAEGVTIDPLPFGLERSEVKGVRARGRVLDVAIEGEKVTVGVDGEVVEGALGTAIFLTD